MTVEQAAVAATENLFGARETWGPIALAYFREYTKVDASEAEPVRPPAEPTDTVIARVVPFYDNGNGYVTRMS